MISSKVWDGVNALLDDYWGLEQGDIVILPYTIDSQEAVAWVSAAIKLRGIPVSTVWMAPLQDSEFSSRFAAVLPNPDDVPNRLVIATFEMDTLSHDHIIRSELSQFDPTKTLVFRVISACESLFSDALMVSPEQLSARNATILEYCDGQKQLTIKTEGGTDLEVEVDSEKFRWVSNRGVWRPGSFTILPAGEVATFPVSINGVLVADFAFNLNLITDMDVRLEQNPVTVWIENSKVVRYECRDKELSKFLDECFNTDCSRIVGELGFGTNFGVDTAIALNSHINERHAGLHLGFGESNQPPSVVGYSCNIHLDLIARGGTVLASDRTEPLNLKNIQPSKHPHPVSTLDEDASSPNGWSDAGYEDDCCGILTKDGIKLWRDEYSDANS